MARKPKLTIPSAIWEELLHELHRRTEELHESGAFLLGHAGGPGRHVSDAVFYDDLDPDAYRTGVGSDACAELRCALGPVPVKRALGGCRHPRPPKGRVPELGRQE